MDVVHPVLCCAVFSFVSSHETGHCMQMSWRRKSARAMPSCVPRWLKIFGPEKQTGQSCNRLAGEGHHDTLTSCTLHNYTLTSFTLHSYTLTPCTLYTYTMCTIQLYTLTSCTLHSYTLIPCTLCYSYTLIPYTLYRTLHTDTMHTLQLHTDIMHTIQLHTDIMHTPQNFTHWHVCVPL